MQNDPSSTNLDPYGPKEIARRVENVGVAKAELAFLPTMMLAILAGAFIALGAAFYTLVITNSGLGFGPARLLGGMAFSLGLILVVVGGAELFTGNNLIVMAWADGKVTHSGLLRNWGIVYVGNFIGALGTAVLVSLSGILGLGDGGGRNDRYRYCRIQIGIAAVRGILCNVLVCLAVWLCFAARTVVGKVVAIIFPVSAFVALSFEHSIANMYLIPIAALAGADTITLMGFLTNLIAVTIGNIIGGSALVAMVYWVIYLRK